VDSTGKLRTTLLLCVSVRPEGSIITESGEKERKVPSGAFGFMMPYLMVPHSRGERFALYLEGTPRGKSTLLAYLYHSVVDFVADGQARGWLRKV
jgi:hypothetical protein